MSVDRHPSLAGKLPQRQTPAGAERLAALVFVGASLMANRGSQPASHQANIRLQASSHKGKRPLALNGLLPLSL
jgi:hypothetical protein